MTTVEKKTSLPQDTPNQAAPTADPKKAQDEKPENIEAVIKKNLTGQEVNLKKAEEELVKKYKLIPGDYRVLVRILEANDLFPKIEEKGMIKDLFKAYNNKEGSANPYVTIELLDKVKKTTIKKKTLNPIYNEQFYFEFKDLIMSQLEEASIIFRVMDYNLPPAADTLIGTFEVDLTTIYFSPGHQIPQASLLLYDPEDKSASTSGMLKVNLEVLGPKDEPNVQNAITSNKPETNKERIMKPAALKPIGHNVEINLFRAEHLPILDFSTEGIDAFAVVKYAGVVKATKIVTSFNPEWNQNIRLGTMLPNQSKAVNVEIWDYDLLNKNDLVGTFKVDFKSFQDKYLAPRWVNLYGPPVSATEEDIAETMRLYGYDIGSHYMGRVLYSIGSYNEKDPSTKITNLNFSFPKNPEPVSSERTYVLRVDLYEAQEIPDREMCIITICIGPYLIKSTPKKISHGRCFIYERFEDKRLVLPTNLEEVPDIFIYFSDKDKEDRRHSFARFKASEFLNVQDPPLKSIKLKEDRSLNLVTDDEFPGYLFAKIGLYNTAPPRRGEFKNKGIKLFEYQLRVMIHVGRGLPPADQEGASDPFVVVRAGGKSAKTSVKRQTLNPGWFETLTMDIKIPEFGESEVPEGISLLVYDSDSHNDEDYDEKELLGRAWMRIENKKVKYHPKNGDAPFDIIYQRPRWKNIIYDALEQYQGKILVSYTLVPLKDAGKVHWNDKIQPDAALHNVHLFLIGIRDINMDELGFFKPLHVSVNFDVSGDSEEAEKGEKFLIVNNGATVNLYKKLTIGVPFSKALTPLLDVHLNGWKMGAKTSQMLGYASIDLKGCLDDFYKMNNPSSVAANTIVEIPEGPESITKLRVKTQTELKVKTQTDIKKQAKSQADLNKKEPTLNSQPDQNIPEQKVEGTLEDIEVQLREEEDKSPIFKKEPTQLIESQKRVGSQKLDKVGGDTQRMETDEQGRLLDLGQEDRQYLYAVGKVIKRAIDNEKKDVDTFRIQKDNSFDYTQLQDDFLGLDNIERENQPDPTKGNVEELKNRGLVVQKKNAGSKFMDLIFGKDEVIEYHEYDSDDNEELSVIPQWIEKRATVPDELEDIMGPNPEIRSFPISRGRTRGRASWFGDPAPAGISTLANLKAIFLEGTGPEMEAKAENYLKLMEPKKYACRVYVLEGVNITKPKHPRELPDTYLVVKIGKEVKNDLRNSLRLQNHRPEYYNRYDFLVDIPSASSLEIEVWHHNKLLKDEFLGKTVIDLEHRHFHPNWRKDYPIRPIEYRSLLNEDEKGTYGKLSVWVDLDPVEEKAKMYEIAPQEKVECELRVIVWEAKNFVHRNTATQASDLFVRGYIGGRNGEAQETDIHWRARAKASFNWRFKYNMTLPFSRDSLGEDRFKLELWDKDVLASDAALGEADIYLNTHKMLDKVYKRRQGVKMMLKYQNKDKKEIKTDQIWYDVMGKDAAGNKVSTGKVLVSFELIPLVEAEKKKNGLGRDAPNNFPNLSEPVGRFSFDIFSPLQTLKELIGPSAYRKLCLCLCCLFVLVIGVMFGYFILTSAVGAAIAK